MNITSSAAVANDLTRLQHLWRFKWIVRGEMNLNHENSSSIRTVWWPANHKPTHVNNSCNNSTNDTTTLGSHDHIARYARRAPSYESDAIKIIAGNLTPLLLLAKKTTHLETWALYHTNLSANSVTVNPSTPKHKTAPNLEAEINSLIATDNTASAQGWNSPALQDVGGSF